MKIEVSLHMSNRLEVNNYEATTPEQLLSHLKGQLSAAQVVWPVLMNTTINTEMPLQQAEIAVSKEVTSTKEMRSQEVRLGGLDALAQSIAQSKDLIDPTQHNQTPPWTMKHPSRHGDHD